MKKYYKVFMFLCAFVSLWQTSSAQRTDILLNENWQSKLIHSNNWENVTLPHNWDQYYGYRRMVHGNLHDTAIYKRNLFIATIDKNKLYHLQFEGVGSYAFIKVNGEDIDFQIGGRTSFIVDITAFLKKGNNLIEVQATHPANIKDMPWVCGGCSSERGFSEGSQPLGIFRNVHLITTNKLFIKPFGVYAYSKLENGNGTLFIETSFTNKTEQPKTIRLQHLLVDDKNKIINETSQVITIVDIAAKTKISLPFKNIELWSLQNPYLYKIVTKVFDANKLIDEVKIDFGFRTIKWAADKSKFFINDKQVFVNGIAEYEHLMGNSHSFSNAQINSRIKWIQSAGFNAFRDAHQPHNLLYGKLLNQKGMLWWTQFSAHIWYDTEEFKFNFKKLLTQWVLERRNDPALFMWGIQNESKLPKEFTEECAQIIRSLDATASTQRLITTCNGGTGADWDVPQNWSGTYGGDVNNYGNELKQQKLVGEYGAWRTLGLHNDSLNAEGYTEEKACKIIETKIRKAYEVKDSVVGHFFWLFNSHENPGRVQGGEGLREIDRIGPVNYKGMLTAWEEPTDLYYLYKSNFTSKIKNPMVYIVSHSWPTRFLEKTKTKNVIVYSNCDEVELHDFKNKISYGRISTKGIGCHFEWEVDGMLNGNFAAYGYVNGKKVAVDTLPSINNFQATISYGEKPFIIKNLFVKDYEPYLKYDFGGGNTQLETFTKNDFINDRVYDNNTIGTTSWTNSFNELPPFYASQSISNSFIKENFEGNLLTTFRYGQNKLKFHCTLPNGKYKVQLFFIEPWIGVVKAINGKEMRMFDVAVNGKIYLKNVDIWKEANGANKLLIKTIDVNITEEKFELSFPNVAAGQALISALQILKPKSINLKPSIIKNYSIVKNIKSKYGSVNHWLSIGDNPYILQNAKIVKLPAMLYGADYFNSMPLNDTIHFSFNKNTNVFLAKKAIAPKVNGNGWEQITDKMSVEIDDKLFDYIVYKKSIKKENVLNLNLDSFDIIAFQEFNSMQPAFDLKPIKQYKANVAFVTDNVIKDSLQNRICTIVQNNDTTNITFPIEIGAADIYSFTTKYFSESENNIEAIINIKDANGVVQLNEKVFFAKTKKGKWNQFTNNTTSQINAGKYLVSYNFINAAGLAINGIDVQ